MLIKFIGAVAIFYLWFSVFSLPAWEKLDLLTPQYASSEVSLWLDGASTEELPFDVHEASISTVISYMEKKVDVDEDTNYEEKYDALCSAYEQFCSVIDFQGRFDAEEKYTYFVGALFTLIKLDRTLQYWYPLEDIIATIQVTNENGNRRGYANWDSIVINLWSVDSYSEYLELLWHEIGHIIDLWVVNGTSKKKHGSFTEFWKKKFAVDDPSLDYYKLSWKSETVRSSSSKKEDFCSWYGMSDPFEDFAECHNLYLNHNDLFRYLAKKNSILKQKFIFISNLYDGKYLFTTKKDLTKVKNNVGRRPWDTTTL